MAELAIKILHLGPSLAWLVYALAGAVQVALVLTVLLVSVAVFIWMERKVSARIQDRLGPTRTGGRFGWLQSPADGLKLLCKEDLIPGGADRLLFRLAPYISFMAPFTAFLAIPFASGWVADRLDTAVFFVLAVAGLEVFGVILGGYASGSKWSLYGAMREAAQVVSYEIPLGICVVVPVLLAGTMDLVSIGDAQAGWCGNWFLLHDPFTFVTFWVYVTCATAGVNRAPFDLAEAESELVAGFMTEYSGFRWSIFMMAEYTAMYMVSGAGGNFVPGRLEWPRAGGTIAGTHRRTRRRGRLGGQPAGLRQFHGEGLRRRHLHDVAALDAAPAPHRPGDDHLFEILRAAGLGHAAGRDAVGVFSSRRAVAVGGRYVGNEPFSESRTHGA